MINPLAGSLARNAVRASGQPIERSLRHDMERRFQFDFGSVRVHSGEQAAAASAALGARAYTVGNDIVLGGRRNSHGTAEGRATMAHELAHVVQQNRMPDSATQGRAIQRLATQGPISSPPGDPAEREAEAAARAVSNGADVAPIREVPVGVTLQTLPDGGTAAPAAVDAGVPDAGGPANAGLADAGPVDAGSASDGGAAKPVCGPDVTKQVKDVVALTRSDFAGWGAGTRELHCNALDSLLTGATAWDIYELHNNSWIYQNYRPACATAGATPPCGSTVQMGADCYYAGSPNYVIFGVMCKACYDHYSAKSDAAGMARFTQSKMEYLDQLL